MSESRSPLARAEASAFRSDVRPSLTYSLSMRPDDATERHLAEVDALRAAIVEGPGVLPTQVRTAAARGDGVPDPFGAFVTTIHRHAYRVTDEVVRELQAAGAGDDEVFEIAVAAAYGAARARLDAGLRALRAARVEG